MFPTDAKHCNTIGRGFLRNKVKTPILICTTTVFCVCFFGMGGGLGVHQRWLRKSKLNRVYWPLEFCIYDVQKEISVVAKGFNFEATISWTMCFRTSAMFIWRTGQIGFGRLLSATWRAYWRTKTPQSSPPFCCGQLCNTSNFQTAVSCTFFNTSSTF